MNAEPPFFLLIGLLMVTGLAAGTLTARLGAPRVLGYVPAGMLFSSGLLGDILGLGVQGWIEPLVEFALGIIAYLIGGTMTTAQLRRSSGTILGAAASPDEDLDDVLHRLMEQGLEDLPVVDARKHLLGVVNLSAVLPCPACFTGQAFWLIRVHSNSDGKSAHVSDCLWKATGRIADRPDHRGPWPGGRHCL